MLVLTRKKDEAVVINDQVTIRVVEIKNGQVKLGIEAPGEVTIHREEVYLRILEENKRAALEAPEDLSGIAAFFGGSDKNDQSGESSGSPGKHGRRRRENGNTDR